MTIATNYFLSALNLSSEDDFIIISAVILLLIIVLIIFISIPIIIFLLNFSKELRYLNLEIGRSTGEERKFYIKQRRRLWLSLIPFVRPK